MDDRERVEEYRRRAREAAERAKAVHDAKARRTYTELAEGYVQLALMVERNMR